MRSVTHAIDRHRRAFRSRLRLPARVHKQVCEFINFNRDMLIDYWEQRIDDDELRERLKPLPKR
jgi:hypothetical protein